MSPPTSLLGPPHLRHLPPAAGGHSSVDPIDEESNNNCRKPPMGLTQNLSPAFASSGNPNLDFFFQVVPTTPSSVLMDLLSKSWIHNPLTALKLVCNLRGVRGAGKSDREGFYSSVLWIHSHHPKTLALNIYSFARFGYMKDLLVILYRLLHGPETRKAAEKEKRIVKPKVRGFKAGRKVATRMDRLKIGVEKTRRVTREELALRVVERYNRDLDYQFLHDCVSEFFAKMLLSDVEQWKLGNLDKIGLAAKWCPSLSSSFDRSTLICESIARWMWAKDSCDEYREIEEAHYAYRVRDRLRREVLVPIRKVLELPEVYMSAGKWDSLPYNRVASLSMKNYVNIFKKHDGKLFDEYLAKVKEGKDKIAAGALLPHEILALVKDPEARCVAELQWNRMVQNLSENGRLKNCIAVCNMSWGMTGTPMDVCVALGLLVSELSEEPWKGRVITFSEKPQLHKIEGETLVEKMGFVQRMEEGFYTDFQKVFDRILDVARKGNLVKDKMIKRVFVFSDMEFDQASANPWETDYEAICRKFRESGYGDCVPEIVFWNLRDSRSTPVLSSQKGVALVSGFSKNLVKLFLDGNGALDPVSVMEDAISGEEYQKLVVFD